MLQATLSQIDIGDAGLKTEAVEMIKFAERLSKCLTEYFLAIEFVNNKFKSLISSHMLTKCFQMNTWKFAPVNENDVPNCKMTVEFSTDKNFTIAVLQSKHHPNHEEVLNLFITLVVGDTDNNLIAHSEDM